MDHVQACLGLQLLLGARDPRHEIPRLSLAAPEAREVQDAAPERQQLVLGHGPRVALVVRRMPRHPQRLLRDLEDACAAQLDEAWRGVRMRASVQIYKLGALAGPFERKGDEDGIRAGKRPEGPLVMRVRVELELLRALPSCRRRGGVRDVV